MRAMYFLIFISVFSSCIYDPPREGKNIFIENQTDDYIYVVDSLKGDQKPKLYDTMMVNQAQYISANSNYISRFCKAPFFILDANGNQVNTKKMTVLELFIIPNLYCNMSFEDIRKHNFYKHVTIDYKNLSKDSVYYLFVRNEGIELTTNFNIVHSKY